MNALQIITDRWVSVSTTFPSTNQIRTSLQFM